MKKLTVSQINCTSVSANAGVSLGADDVFIMHQTDGGMPIRFPASTDVYEMTNGSQQPLAEGDVPGLVLYYNYGAYVSLWDHDGPLNQVDPADLLGCQGFLVTDVSKTYTLKHNNGAAYSIVVTIEDA